MALLVGGRAETSVLAAGSNLNHKTIADLKRAAVLPPGVEDIFRAAACLLDAPSSLSSSWPKGYSCLRDAKAFVVSLRQLKSVIDKNGGLPYANVTKAMSYTKQGRSTLPQEMRKKDPRVEDLCVFVLALLAYSEEVRASRAAAKRKQYESKISNIIFAPPPAPDCETGEDQQNKVLPKYKRSAWWPGEDLGSELPDAKPPTATRRPSGREQDPRAAGKAPVREGGSAAACIFGGSS